VLFNSWTFAAYLAVVLGAYWVLQHGRRWRGQNALLLLASYLFYAAWDWRFLGLLVASTVVDYIAARQIVRRRSERARRAWLIGSLAFSLGLLGFFKYWNFFIGSANDLLTAIGLPMDPMLIRVILPVGISFYTFQTMSYVIDVYRRRFNPTEDLATFALYVSFFPQLVAGPIERAGRLLPQFQRPREVTPEHLASGAWLILLGLFKKMVVADTLAPMVNRVFAADSADAGMVMLAAYAFALQIYGDFSGYTDIARGTAKLMGFELTVNFRLPYSAVSPREFWGRWHVSLSNWMRDYLFEPLGGARRGKLLTLRNLMVTMMLGGLWHGASWNFALWGAYHGLLLIVFYAFGRRRHAPPLTGWRRLFGALGFFQLIAYGCILFRAESIGQIVRFTAALVRLDFAWSAQHAQMLLMLAWFYALVIGLVTWLQAVDKPWTRPGWNTLAGPVTVTGLAWLVLFASSVGAESFIYFQF